MYFKCPVLCPSRESDYLEVIAQGSRACRDIDLRALVRVVIFNHLLDFFERKLLCQRDSAFDAGLVRRCRRDGHLAHREHSLLDRDQESESELLELPVADFLDSVQTQLSGVGLARLQRSGFRDEFDRAVRQPSGSTFYGRRESEDPVFQVGSRCGVSDVGRQFHPDGRLVCDDAAGVGFDESREFGTLAFALAETAA